MKIFSNDEIRTHKIIRAINDLQRGLPITIKQKFLISSVETLSEYNFNKLRTAFKDKLTLVAPTPNGYALQELSNFSLKQIKSFCECNKDRNLLNYNSKLSDESFTEEYYLFVKRIFTFAKLLPIFLFTKLNSNHNQFINDHILKIEQQDLILYEKMINSDVEPIVTNVPIQLNHIGKITITIFRVISTGEQHIAIASANIVHNKTPLVRLHSSCYTGDLLQSLQCDCNSQLFSALKLMNSSPENAGVIIYLAQEGRGIGLANKLRTYALQNKGYDTAEANIQLGFNIDERDYSVAAEILKQLKIKEIKLLTNNPKKTTALTKAGINIRKILPLMTEMNNYNKRYMETKKHKMAHTI
ncbi:MAG: GTP cyclohydrolase II [Rickettsiales bacterium]|nr:GTP cyclohydrolase II [Rickettsiales bacterium]